MQTTKAKTAERREAETPVDHGNKSRSPRAQAVLDAIDDIIDDLEDVLEENEEEMAEVRTDLSPLVVAKSELEEMMWEFGYIQLPCVC
jgi:predicted NAD/FAD-dependent oxidoreductase